MGRAARLTLVPAPEPPVDLGRRAAYGAGLHLSGWRANRKLARLGCAGLTMVHFNDIVSADALATGLAANGKKQLFQKIAAIAAIAYGLAPGDVADALFERERLGSTGFGGGVAIPHAKIAGLQQMRGVVVLLDPPLPFDAVDEAPVDIVFALLSPLDSGADHLKTLARVSRYLRDDGEITRLRGAQSAEALFALIAGSEARDAA